VQANFYVFSLMVFELVSNGLSIDFKCVARWTNIKVQAIGSTHGGCHYVKQTAAFGSSWGGIQEAPRSQYEDPS
jgi:hypothetical protein